MSIFSTLLMSAIYITNGLGQYLTIGEDGTASLSSSPVSIELTKADEEGNFDNGRYLANNTKPAWTMKTSGNGTYTIGCQIPDAYGTAFLYTSKQGSSTGDAKGFLKTGEGISLTYQEPDASFTSGQWYVSTEIGIQEVALNETQSYVKPTFTKPLVNVKLKRTLYAKEWNSFCVPFPITTEQTVENWGEGTIVATFYGVSGTRLLFKTCRQIEAGKPYVLLPEKVNENQTYSFDGINASDWSQALGKAGNESDNADIMTSVGQFQYIGKYEPATVPSRAYVFGDGDKMYHLTSDMTMNGFRAYFWDTATGTSAAKQLTWGFSDTPTSIEVIPGNDANGRKSSPTDIYKLDGKVVKRKATSTEGLRPGIYIMNGMKVIVK